MSLGRSGFIPPAKVIPKALPPMPRLPVIPTPRVGQPSGMPTYDPSRIIPRAHLKVVKDLRQNGVERGEVQTGDGGVLGPGSRQGSFATRTQALPTTPSKAGGLTPLQMGLLAVAAFLAFGG